LRDLLEHGLIQTTQSSSSLVPVFTCFPIRARETINQLHVWDLFTKYYEIKVTENKTEREREREGI
jgi:hypothetical protein